MGSSVSFPCAVCRDTEKDNAKEAQKSIKPPENEPEEPDTVFVNVTRSGTLEQTLITELSQSYDPKTIVWNPFGHDLEEVLVVSIWDRILPQKTFKIIRFNWTGHNRHSWATQLESALRTQLLDFKLQFEAVVPDMSQSNLFGHCLVLSKPNATYFSEDRVRDYLVEVLEVSELRPEELQRILNQGNRLFKSVVTKPPAPSTSRQGPPEPPCHMIVFEVGPDVIAPQYLVVPFEGSLKNPETWRDELAEQIEVQTTVNSECKYEGLIATADPLQLLLVVSIHRSIPLSSLGRMTPPHSPVAKPPPNNFSSSSSIASTTSLKSQSSLPPSQNARSNSTTATRTSSFASNTSTSPSHSPTSWPQQPLFPVAPNQPRGPSQSLPAGPPSNSRPMDPRQNRGMSNPVPPFVPPVSLPIHTQPQQPSRQPPPLSVPPTITANALSQHNMTMQWNAPPSSAPVGRVNHRTSVEELSAHSYYYSQQLPTVPQQLSPRHSPHVYNPSMYR